MPRNRNLDDDISSKTDILEEDYLDVDKPLPGQNFYCISFVSPDKVLRQKEQYFYHYYERNNIIRFRSMFNSKFEDIISKCEDGTVDISEIIKLKKNLDEACGNELVTFEKFQEKFEDFKFADEEKISEAFDKANNFQTSVRGVKIRGTFDTKREADVRAAVLQRQDPSFDVFIGQVGYWCPWDPNAQKIQDIEYLNNDLNKLVKEYKLNEAKKDVFYNEQKMQRQKDAHTLTAEERLKHKEGIDKTNAEKQEMHQKSLEAQMNNMKSVTNGNESLIGMNDVKNLEDILTIGETTNNAITGLDIGTSFSKESTIEEQSALLTSDDPWLKRKQSEQTPQ
jgi:hypothetical protein